LYDVLRKFEVATQIKVDQMSLGAVFSLVDAQRAFHVGLGATIIILVLFQILAAIEFRRDQQFLLELVNAIVPLSLPSSEQAKRIVAYLAERSLAGNESFFLAPILRFLRPTPRQVAKAAATALIAVG
jgi:hypothetical protein